VNSAPHPSQIRTAGRIGAAEALGTVLGGLGGRVDGSKSLNSAMPSWSSTVRTPSSPRVAFDSSRKNSSSRSPLTPSRKKIRSSVTTSRPEASFRCASISRRIVSPGPTNDGRASRGVFTFRLINLGKLRESLTPSGSTNASQSSSASRSSPDPGSLVGPWPASFEEVIVILTRRASRYALSLLRRHDRFNVSPAKSAHDGCGHDCLGTPRASPTSTSLYCRLRVHLTLDSGSGHCDSFRLLFWSWFLCRPLRDYNNNDSDHGEWYSYGNIWARRVPSEQIDTCNPRQLDACNDTHRANQVEAHASLSGTVSVPWHWHRFPFFLSDF